MELAVKLLTLTWCVSVLSRAATISNNLNSGSGRIKKSRNSIRNRHNDSPNPKFLAIRRAPPPEFTTDLNENWILECEAGGSPPPTLHWLRNGKAVKQQTVRHISDDDAVNNAIPEGYTSVVGIGSTKSRLFLDCTGPQDEATYTCVAETPYQRVSADSKVLVSAVNSVQRNSMCVSRKKSLGTPARISMWTGNMLETMGNDVVLFCRTMGSPTPAAIWSIEDENISGNTAKYQIQGNGDLLIRNIDWSDMGEYVCTATNEFGKDIKTTFLYPVKKED